MAKISANKKSTSYLSSLADLNSYNVFGNGHALGGALVGLAWATACSALAYYYNADIPHELYAGIIATGPAIMVPLFGAYGSMLKEDEDTMARLEKILASNKGFDLKEKNEQKELERLRKKPLLDKLVKIYESSQTYKQGHIANVVGYCRKLGRAMELSPSELSDLTTAAKLCDIGEIFIPRDIWTKECRLNQAEIREVCKHPVYGEEFLRDFDLVNDNVLALVRGHHEAFDGSGYPDRKVGQYAQVCVPDNLRMGLACAILSVVDSYVSMTEKRPHKNRVMSKQAVFAELIDNAGTQFDPACVDKLIAIVNEEDTLARTTNHYQTRNFKRETSPSCAADFETGKFSRDAIGASEPVLVPRVGSGQISRPDPSLCLGKPLTKKFRKADLMMPIEADNDCLSASDNGIVGDYPAKFVDAADDNY